MGIQFFEDVYRILIVCLFLHWYKIWDHEKMKENYVAFIDTYFIPTFEKCSQHWRHLLLVVFLRLPSQNSWTDQAEIFTQLTSTWDLDSIKFWVFGFVWSYFLVSPSIDRYVTITLDSSKNWLIRFFVLEWKLTKI